MAKRDKIYGDRWRVGNAISGGGQATVYRATDITGVLEGEYALKRVANAKRHHRFRSEVEAVKRLQHPNVIRLIDHSALEDSATTETKQYLVMPIAAGGDLGAADRLALYKNNLDSTLTVALQLASALAAAHEAEIVHRDVKPGNVLFTWHGHDLWLSDFGICLLREAPRFTPDDEVVGPRGFIAPECEDGGRLEVDGRADIYSLGKVIHYMLSGGRVIPRERLNEAQFGDVFAGGARHTLLKLLLQQMICLVDDRLATMNEVADRLERIVGWEKQALIPPVSVAGLSAAERLRQRSLTTERVAAENAKARAEEDSVLATAKSAVEGFLQTELEKSATELSSGGALSAEVQGIAPADKIRFASNGWFEPLGGRALSLAMSPRDPHRRHLLEFLLCEEKRMTTRVLHGPRKPEDDLRPARDVIFAVLARYSLLTDQRSPTAVANQGFLSNLRSVGISQTLAPDLAGPHRQPRQIRVQHVMKSYIGGVALSACFKAVEWPVAADSVRQLISAAHDTFFAFIESDTPFIGD